MNNDKHVRLQKESTVLLVVDIQEKFLPHLQLKERILKNTELMIEAANQFNVPIIVTEQNPDGLGLTDDSLRSKVEENQIYSKHEFSCLINESIASVLKGYLKEGRFQLLLCGIEGHICIFQTAMDALAQGFQVHLLEDAIGSFIPINLSIAISRMTSHGVLRSTTELAIYDLLKTQKHADFKALYPLFKQRTKEAHIFSD